MAAERAQLVLATALVLATLFVGLALLLNTALYTENLATRSTGSPDAASLHQQEADAGVTGAIRHANRNHYTSDATLTSNFSAAVGDLDGIVAGEGSLRGDGVQVTVGEPRVGRRIVQDDPARNFTAGGDIAAQTNWTLSEDATRAVWFRQNIQTHSTVDATGSTTLATLAKTAYSTDVVDADGDRWSVYLFRGAATNNLYLLVERPGQDFENDTAAALDAWPDQRCSRQNDTVVIDYGAGTMDGEQCGPLGFFAGDPPTGWQSIDAPYTIEYRNTRADTLLYTGDTVRGTYLLLLDQSALPSPTPYYDATTGRSPRAPPAIYATDVRLDYRTADLAYAASWESVPADPDRIIIGGTPPTITSWSVRDDSSLTNGAKFDVNWTVDDPNGDMDEVTVYLFDASSGDIVDRARADVSGAGTSASGTLTVQNALDALGEEYRLVVEVTDLAANTDDAETTQAADGDDST